MITYRVTQVTRAGLFEGAVRLSREPEDIMDIVYHEDSPRLDMRGTLVVLIVKQEETPGDAWPVAQDFSVRVAS